MRHVKIESGVKMCLACILLSQLFFLNGIYLLISMICLLVGLYYLQQPYKPSVFTIIFFYHFLQIIAGVWQATYLGNDINFRSENMGVATLISLAGLLCLFAPIIYFQNKIPAITFQTLKDHANKFSINKSFYAYVIAFFAAALLNGIRFLLPGYTQVIISLVNLKWFFFLLFGFQAILKNKRRKEFYFFILFEFILGFYSFFSEFKTIIFFTGVLYLTFLYHFTVKRLFTGIAIISIVFLLATIWTTIKVDYRMFLTRGTASQNVNVSENEALTKLYELTNSEGTHVTSSGTEKFLDRLQGTYHLAKTMESVPAKIPFQNGNNWLETLSYVFTPRLLNPDKPQLNTSAKASKYTGIQYAGIDQATSFSLGYFADCYIDFGLLGMLLPLTLIGVLYGITYFYFLRNSSQNYIFNYSVVCALFMRYFAIEMDSIFFIGSLFTDLLTFFILSKVFFPWLCKTLLAPKGTDI